jgi:transcriptional regulator with XRE-family HTH domain
VVHNEPVPDDLMALLAGIDPEVLGRRIRRARLDLDITQGELAGEDASIGYISRIESGKRRPEFRLFEKLAKRLGTSVESLLSGEAEADPSRDRIRMLVDHAELSLRGGSADEAERLLDEAADLGAAEDAEFAERHRYLAALVMETQGRQEDAVLALEDLVAAGDDGPFAVQVAIALSRVHRESGDLTRAIAVAEAGLEAVRRRGLEGTDEGVQLVVTLAGAYYLAGDIAHAARVCRRAVAQAESLHSPLAMASAYWNSSLVEAERGATRTAAQMAERALGLMATVEGNRNVGKLQSQLGQYQLALDPPEIEAARANFEAAERQYELSSASPIDRSRNTIASARADLLCGELDQARAKATVVADEMRTTSPLLGATALVTLGMVALEEGEAQTAARWYRDAIAVLTGVGVDRAAGALWFELGSLLDELGLMSEARDAYRSAAASSGLATSYLTTRRSRV